MSKYAVLLLVAALLFTGDASRKVTAAEGGGGQKLREALPGSQFSAAAVKLEDRSKALVISASTITVAPDGRVRLNDCTIARYRKGGKPTTIQSEYAYFTLDGVVRSITDLARRRILAVELAGGVSMTLDGQ
jgi:hypothetical protein